MKNNKEINSEYPLISVVIPCYKAEKYVCRAIDSVLAQPLVNVEIIVVEDGIFDNTKNVISCYDKKIKFISYKTNQGAPAARNTGLEAVTSEYVMFLDADDFLEGELLRGLYDAIQLKSASVAFATGIKRWKGSTKESVFIPPKDETPLQVVERWLNGNSGPSPCSILWNTSEIIRIGGWNTDIIRNQDGELIIRAMLRGCTVTSNERGAGVYCQHSNKSVSRNRDPTSFHSQEIIEMFVQKWLEENGNPKEISDSLNQFRLQVALLAYRNSLDNIGKYWEEKWKKYGGKSILFSKVSPKGSFRYKLVAKISYAVLGYRRGELFIASLLKLFKPYLKLSD